MGNAAEKNVCKMRDDLKALLSGSGLAEAVPVFEEHQVFSLAVAKHLTAADLREWGVDSVPRRAILNVLGIDAGEGKDQSFNLRVEVIREYREDLVILVLPSDTVATLKARIEREKGVPPDHQNMSFSDQLLEDHRTLSSYNINNEDATKYTPVSIYVHAPTTSFPAAYQIFVKALNGKIITLEVTPDTRCGELSEMIQDQEGIPPDQQALIYDGTQIFGTISKYDPKWGFYKSLHPTPVEIILEKGSRMEKERQQKWDAAKATMYRRHSSTLRQLGIGKEANLRIVLRLRGGCIAAPIPAVFDVHTGALGSHFLRDPTRMQRATAEEVVSLIEAVGGQLCPAEPPICAPDKILLNARQRTALVRRIDALHRDALNNADGDNPPTDFRIAITRAQLVEWIGGEEDDTTIQQLERAFGGPHDTIKVRRVEASHGAPPLVPFHTDTHSRRTMQIPLNEDFRGGQLVFATKEDGFLLVNRPAGSYTIHTCRVAHGVTALEAGTRYSLFLCDTATRPQESQGGTGVDLAFLLPAVRDQFDFFDRATRLLQSCDRTDREAHVRDYLARLCGSNGNHHACMVAAAEAGLLALGVEIVWKTHMLRPALYAQACATSTLPREALDLVAAVQRQEAFMGKVLALADSYDADAAFDDYRAFLQRAGASLLRGESPLEPQLMVDLVWHTHMQADDPLRYRRDCVAVAGRFVDHNDDI